MQQQQRQQQTRLFQACWRERARKRGECFEYGKFKVESNCSPLWTAAAVMFVPVALPTDRPSERPSGMSGGVKTNELPRPLRRPFPPRESQARARAPVSARCGAAVVRHILFNLSVCAELPSSLANMLTELNWPWPPRPPSAGRIPC